MKSIDDATGHGRRPWTAPVLTQLPKLTELTLVTADGDAIDGGGSITGGTGSTVF